MENPSGVGQEHDDGDESLEAGVAVEDEWHPDEQQSPEQEEWVEQYSIVVDVLPRQLDPQVQAFVLLGQLFAASQSVLVFKKPVSCHERYDPENTDLDEIHCVAVVLLFEEHTQTKGLDG